MWNVSTILFTGWSSIKSVLWGANTAHRACSAQDEVFGEKKQTADENSVLLNKDVLPTHFFSLLLV